MVTASHCQSLSVTSQCSLPVTVSNQSMVTASHCHWPNQWSKTLEVLNTTFQPHVTQVVTVQQQSGWTVRAGHTVQTETHWLPEPDGLCWLQCSRLLSSGHMWLFGDVHHVTGMWPASCLFSCTEGVHRGGGGTKQYLLTKWSDTKQLSTLACTYLSTESPPVKVFV